jgi:hypothetical protein
MFRSLRRIFALVLLTVPMQAPAVAFASTTEHAHGRCNDHVCACRHHCTPKKKPAARRCHGGTAADTDASFKSSCRHGHDTASPVVVRPHLTPTAMACAPVPASEGLSVLSSAQASTGFLDIDLPPPRFRASL